MIPSTFWASFIEILRAIFEKKSKNHQFDHIFELYGWTGIFFENRASSLFCIYECLTSCKKSEKSLEPFPRKMETDQPTNRPTLSPTGSTKVENCNAGDLLAQRQSTSTSSTFKLVLTRLDQLITWHGQKCHFSHIVGRQNAK